jgi:hypothetical protein
MANITIDHITNNTESNNSTTLVTEATAQTNELEIINRNTHVLKAILERQIKTNDILNHGSKHQKRL